MEVAGLALGVLGQPDVRLAVEDALNHLSLSEQSGHYNREIPSEGTTG